MRLIHTADWHLGQSFCSYDRAFEHQRVHPDELAEHRAFALELGFAHCESGPLVRSSYHAHEHVGGPLRGGQEPLTAVAG